MNVFDAAVIAFARHRNSHRASDYRFISNSWVESIALNTFMLHNSGDGLLKCLDDHRPSLADRRAAAAGEFVADAE